MSLCLCTEQVVSALALSSISEITLASGANSGGVESTNLWFGCSTSPTPGSNIQIRARTLCNCVTHIASEATALCATPVGPSEARARSCSRRIPSWSICARLVGTINGMYLSNLPCGAAARARKRPAQRTRPPGSSAGGQVGQLAAGRLAIGQSLATACLPQSDDHRPDKHAQQAEGPPASQGSHQSSQEIDLRPPGHQRRPHKFVIRKQHGESDSTDQNRGCGRAARQQTNTHRRDRDIPYEREHCRQSRKCSPGCRGWHVYR